MSRFLTLFFHLIVSTQTEKATRLDEQSPQARHEVWEASSRVQGLSEIDAKKQS